MPETLVEIQVDYIKALEELLTLEKSQHQQFRSTMSKVLAVLIQGEPARLDDKVPWWRRNYRGFVSGANMAFAAAHDAHVTLVQQVADTFGLTISPITGNEPAAEGVEVGNLETTMNTPLQTGQVVLLTEAAQAKVSEHPPVRENEVTVMTTIENGIKAGYFDGQDKFHTVDLDNTEFTEK